MLKQLGTLKHKNKQQTIKLQYNGSIQIVQSDPNLPEAPRSQIDLERRHGHTRHIVEVV